MNAGMTLGEERYSISLAKANILSLILFIPLSALYLVPHILVWGWEKTVVGVALMVGEFWLFLALIVIGIVVHELLHGLTWKWLGGKSWRDIKFGFNWSALAPYAHCRVPIEVNAYRWGAAMPGLILGALPFLIGLSTGLAWFTLFGFIFTITASGDLIILWVIRNIEPGTPVRDHPERAGCELPKTKTGYE